MRVWKEQLPRWFDVIYTHVIEVAPGRLIRRYDATYWRLSMMSLEVVETLPTIEEITGSEEALQIEKEWREYASN